MGGLRGGPPRAQIGLPRRLRRRARSYNELGPEGGKALGDALAKGAFPALQTLILRWVAARPTTVWNPGKQLISLLVDSSNDLDPSLQAQLRLDLSWISNLYV